MVATVALEVQDQRRRDEDDRDLAELDAEVVAEQRREQIAGGEVELLEGGDEANLWTMPRMRTSVPPASMSATRNRMKAPSHSLLVWRCLLAKHGVRMPDAGYGTGQRHRAACSTSR